MSSAAAKAEARRKAILARGGDRLAKLTSSARGEDASAYLHDDPPLAQLPTNGHTLGSFVGEQSTIPKPTPTLTAAAPQPAPKPRPSDAVLTGAPQLPPAQEEQMRQFREALAAAAGPSLPSSTPGDDPLTVLMASMTQPGGMPGVPQQKAAAATPKTRFQKLLPFIHLIAAWVLLMYFILHREPEVFGSRTHSLPSDNVWKRWAELAWKSPSDGWGVQPVPFFWAFTALTLALQAWRISSRVNTPQLPTLLALALPQLPPPLPSIVMNGLSYLQIGGTFLDDVAGLLVGIGLFIWIAGWLAD
ncbi:hypothetical protein DAEQUDRAFT_766033 [Daedalea quercina L-15889]|uniref:GET complex, subunit GET2 n=1 Tax=Daedalea quercina L-15889 TaxID=1314783 RepID=A0A165Q033_9APHY|nr:hypothetical protein DAEQUDRAFT_766033 [Daedalea quercina L-15889]